MLYVEDARLRKVRRRNVPLLLEFSHHRLGDGCLGKEEVRFATTARLDELSFDRHYTLLLRAARPQQKHGVLNLGLLGIDQVHVPAP